MTAARLDPRRSLSGRVVDAHEAALDAEAAGEARAQRLDAAALAGVVAGGEELHAGLARGPLRHPRALRAGTATLGLLEALTGHAVRW